jgi:hypothetical protein
VKKPFNPMLGETYELVTEDYRFFAEQVCHHPPISAFIQEGRGYKCQAFMESRAKFGFGGGLGLMEVHQKGYFDYYYEKFNETISIGRPKIIANNIVMGKLYLDINDEITVLNHKTREKANI